jgi:ferredoxin
MGRKTIYFFSGAGHSFAVARDLAAGLGETELVNMSTLFGVEEVADDSLIIGLVFPVYGSKPPKIVREWLECFRPAEASIVFAVCTCAIGPGHSMIAVDEILKSKGNRLSWGFSVMQPQAGIGSGKLNTPELVNTLMIEQKKKVDDIIRHISENKPQVMETSPRFSEFLNSSTITALPTMAKLIFHLVTKGVKNMKFHPGADCIGCGTCVKLCPVNNITMTDGHPRWGDSCTGCMGCYHWCPQDAVTNVDLDMIQSPHPDVEVYEMLKYGRDKERE